MGFSLRGFLSSPEWGFGREAASPSQCLLIQLGGHWWPCQWAHTQHRHLSGNTHVISLALRGALVLGVQPGISCNIQPPCRLFPPAPPSCGGHVPRTSPCLLSRAAGMGSFPTHSHTRKIHFADSVTSVSSPFKRGDTSFVSAKACMCSKSPSINRGTKETSWLKTS